MPAWRTKTGILEEEKACHVGVVQGVQDLDFLEGFLDEGTEWLAEDHFREDLGDLVAAPSQLVVPIHLLFLQVL